MKKIEIKKLKKRTDIIDSAYELFTTQGYENTSVFNIAVKAGVGKGTFYLYFDSKEAVRDELIRIKASKLLMDSTSATELKFAAMETNLPPIDKLILLLDHIIDQLMIDKDLLKFISKNLTWGLLANAEENDSEEVIDFREYIVAMMEKEHVELKNPPLLIFTILELVSSTCYSVIIDEEPVKIDEFKPYLYENIRLIVENGIVK